MIGIFSHFFCWKLPDRTTLRQRERGRKREREGGRERENKNPIATVVFVLVLVLVYAGGHFIISFLSFVAFG